MSYASKISAALIIIGASGGAAAITEISPIVVYGSRIEDASATIPANVQVITAMDIREAAARDLSELLGKKANLQIRTMGANPMQRQVAMRGFGENSFGRVKIVVDGEELNSVDMEGPNLANIQLEQIERIEIIHGPSGVLYGDGASAGVINIITSSRDHEGKTRIHAKAGSEGEFGLGFNTKGAIDEEGVQYFASYGYDRADGYRERSGWDRHSLLAALCQNFDGGAYLRFKANYFNSFYQMPGALTWEEWQTEPRQAQYYHDWCRLWNYGLAMDAKVVIDEDQRLLVNGAFSVRHRTSNWGDYDYQNDYDLYSYQLSPRYINEKRIAELDNKLTLGADFRYERYEVRDRSGYNNPDYHFDRARAAVFGHDELAISETLTLIAGARLEHIANRWTNYAGLLASSSHDTMGDYELALIYTPIEELKTYIKGSRYHRSAFCDELNYTEDGTFLKPETGSSLDIGLEAAITEELHFDLSGYWSVIDDEIFYNPHAKEYGANAWGGYNCNSPARTERLGLDTALVWRRERTAEATIRYSFVKAQFAKGEYEGKDIPIVPQHRLRAEFGIWAMDDLEVIGGYNFVASQVLAGDFDNEHGHLPCYSLFDVKAVYEPHWAQGWKISFIVENLLDRRYCDFAGWSDYGGAYYYPAAGRSFMVTISYEW